MFLKPLKTLLGLLLGVIFLTLFSACQVPYYGNQWGYQQQYPGYGQPGYQQQGNPYYQQGRYVRRPNQQQARQSTNNQYYPNRQRQVATRKPATRSRSTTSTRTSKPKVTPPQPKPDPVVEKPTVRRQKPVDDPAPTNIDPDPDRVVVKKPPFGLLIPGKDGYVYSPHAKGEKKIVDVKGIPKGSEVRDPYTGKKFLVP